MAKGSFDPSLAETVIGNGLHVKGHLKSTNDIWIDGIVEGDVVSGGGIVISVNGQVKGNLQAAHISIGGRVNGNIKARDRLVVDASGHLRGEIETEKLVVADGALINGPITMPDHEAEPNQSADEKTGP